jgi:hypothetical protein
MPPSSSSSFSFSWIRRSVLCLTVLVACAPGTSDSETEQAKLNADSAAQAGNLPCDVSAVIEKNCSKCHGSRPVYGAPMPIVSSSDVHATSKSDASKKVWQRIGERIHDAASPMPPSGVLSEGELATLDSWIKAGAPQQASPQTTGECAKPGDTTPAASHSAPELPCPENERTTFRAHATGKSDAPFEVPEDAGNLEMCFTYRSPWAAGTQATAFKAVLDDARVIHHLVLFETSTPQAENGVGRCAMPADAAFLQGWAPGNDGIPLPPDVGLRLPSNEGKWLILQVHYWNGARLTDSRDRSGISMCTTKTPRPHTAIISTLGSMGINLPPRSTGTTISSTCTPQANEPLHVIAAGPHMHRLGRKLTTDIWRGGSDSDRTSLVNVQRWNFEQQTTYPIDVVINPGDKLVTTCEFDNPTDKRVTFGERTEDEMCFNFVAVWPPPGLVNTAGVDVQRCIDQ